MTSGNDIFRNPIGNIRWTRKIAYVLDIYGLIMSASSFISFLYQGTPGIGVITALAVFSCMGVFHSYVHNSLDIDGNYR